MGTVQQPTSTAESETGVSLLRSPDRASIAERLGRFLAAKRSLQPVAIWRFRRRAMVWRSSRAGQRPVASNSLAAAAVSDHSGGPLPTLFSQLAEASILPSPAWIGRASVPSFFLGDGRADRPARSPTLPIWRKNHLCERPSSASEPTRRSQFLYEFDSETLAATCCTRLHGADRPLLALGMPGPASGRSRMTAWNDA